MKKVVVVGIGIAIVIAISVLAVTIHLRLPAIEGNEVNKQVNASQKIKEVVNTLSNQNETSNLGQQENTENHEKTMKIANINFSINYTITGGEITKAVANLEHDTVILFLNSTSDGKIVLKYPAKMNRPPTTYYDFTLFVWTDQETSQYATIHDTNGTFTIDFKKGTKEITMRGFEMCNGMPCMENPFLIR